MRADYTECRSPTTGASNLLSLHSNVIRWLGNLFRTRTAVQSARDNPVLHATVRKSAEIYDIIPLRQLIDDEDRETLSRQMFLEINGICNSVDPIATCREKLALAMLRFASLQVLTIPPDSEHDISGLRGQPGITGELQPHIVEIASRNETLRSELHSAGAAMEAEVVTDMVERLYWEAYWYLETCNAARVELGDFREEEDWFDSFKHAACASAEHIYRREAGLPPAFDGELASLAPTAYSIFTDIVLSGATEPDIEWQDYYKDSNVPVPSFTRQ